MPIYEYRCDSCGFQKEYIQRMSDQPLTDCPECKKPTFSKLVSAAGFQLKGGGWYVTDFKGGGSKGEKKQDVKSDSGSSSSSSSGSSGDSGKSGASSSGGATSSPSASSSPAATKSSSGTS